MTLVARALVPVILLAHLALGCESARPQRPATGTAGAGGAGGGGIAGASRGGTSGDGAVANEDGGVGASEDGGAGSTGNGGTGAPLEGGAAGSAPDRGGDGAAGARGSCEGVFCEDFELGQIDPAKWSAPAMGGATMTVQTKTVAHGRYAVQFHGAARPSSNDYVYLITKIAPPALQKHSFGRAYMYMSPQRNDIDMGLVFGGTAGFPKPTYMSIANHGTGWQLGFIKLSGAPGGETQTYPPGDIPVAKWMCLEWELNDNPDEMNVWGDGKAIGTLNKDSKVGFCSGGCSQPASLYDNMNSGLIGAFTDFGFGFYDCTRWVVPRSISTTTTSCSARNAWAACREGRLVVMDHAPSMGRVRIDR
jgi:hypothetical protein